MTGDAAATGDGAGERVEVWAPTTILRLRDYTIIRVTIPPPWSPWSAWSGNRAERRRRQPGA